MHNERHTILCLHVYKISSFISKTNFIQHLIIPSWNSPWNSEYECKIEKAKDNTKNPGHKTLLLIIYYLCHKRIKSYCDRYIVVNCFSRNRRRKLNFCYYLELWLSCLPICVLWNSEFVNVVMQYIHLIIGTPYCFILTYYFILTCSVIHFRKIYVDTWSLLR